jgi:hypothetical protein
VPNLVPVGKHCNCWVAAWARDDSSVAKTIKMEMEKREIERDLSLDWGSRMPTLCLVATRFEKISMGHMPALQTASVQKDILGE